jgi:hypothetical protein
MEKPNLKLILGISLGFVLVTSLSALASSRAGKNFFANLGRAGVATFNDVKGSENLKLTAEVSATPQAASPKISPKQNKPSVATSIQSKISTITSSIIAAITSSPILQQFKNIPEDITAATTSVAPPPVQEILPEPTSLEPASTIPTPAPAPEPTTTTEIINPPPSPQQTQNIGHIVISVVQIRSVDSTYNDFIVLFNPNWEEVDISDWRICKKTKTGSQDSFKIFPSGSIVPAKGKFTWANSSSSFYLKVDANIWSSDTVASNNSIGLFNGSCGQNQIDAVGWGSGTNQYTEGSSLPNPDSGQLIQRKFNGDVPIDTGDNLSDFEIK